MSGWAEVVPTPLGVGAPKASRAHRLTADEKITYLCVTPHELEACEHAVTAYHRAKGTTPDAILARLKLPEKRHRLLMGLVVTMATEDGA